MKKIILFLTVGIGIAVAVWVGVNQTESFNQINMTAENVAIKGFDTVAFF